MLKSHNYNLNLLAKGQKLVKSLAITNSHSRQVSLLFHRPEHVRLSAFGRGARQTQQVTNSFPSQNKHLSYYHVAP